MSVSCIGWLFVAIGTAFLFEAAVVETRTVRAPVIVNKCCRLNEHLAANGECELGSSENWWPLIHLLQRQQILEPYGTAPKFLRPRERHRPPCRSPQLLFGNGTVALSSNGSLYVPETNQVVDADRFCIDQNAAILCLPPPAASPNDVDALTAPKAVVKIRKCCYGNAAYDKALGKCRVVNQSDEALLRRLVANSTVINYVYGFPGCTNRSHFAIVQTLKESALDLGTGNLTVDSGHQFTWDEYCLERAVSDANRTAPVKVFTCEEDLHTVYAATSQRSQVECGRPIPTPRTENQLNLSLFQDIRFVLFPIGLLISAIFLIVTLATGFILPSNHHMLHWRCQTFYVSCLLVGDLLLAFIQMSQIIDVNYKGPACKFIGECRHVARRSLPMSSPPMLAIRIIWRADITAEDIKQA